MSEKVFFSFHYKPDHWRVSQVRNIGVIEENPAASDNDWESIKKGGDTAIEKWINDQLSGRSCAIVLIGAETANRKWINYEICEAWNAGKGVFGIYIHNLKDSNKEQTKKGENPFDYPTFGKGGAKMSTIVKTYDPPFSESTAAYNYISENLSAWVDTSIAQRKT